MVTRPDCIGSPTRAGPSVKQAPMPGWRAVWKVTTQRRPGLQLVMQVQSGPAFEEGLPAIFEGVRVRTGDGWSAPYTGTVDSGDMVEAVAR